MIALVYNNDTLCGDLVRVSGSIQKDAGLATMIAISLFTWRKSPTSWYGEAYTGPIGSRLYELDGRFRSNDTLRDAEAICREALQWLVDKKIVKDITIAASWSNLGEEANVLLLDVHHQRPSDPAPVWAGRWKYQTS